jgi:Pep3/Vps18/deep orange family
MIGNEAPIWATRSVEWPLPSKLSGSTFQKLWQQQQQMAMNSHPPSSGGGLFSKVGTRGHSSVSNATAIGIGIGKPSADGSGNTSVSIGSTDGNLDVGNATILSANPNQLKAGYSGNNVLSTGSAVGNGSDGTFLTGFMSRVLGPTAANMGSNSSNDRGGIHSASSSDVQCQVNPPPSGCVASSNGWVVAALECVLPYGPMSVSTSPNNVSGGTGSFVLDNVGANNRYTTISSQQNASNRTLRLISRWNVRRASVMSDHWIVLPPPMSGVTTNPQNQQQLLLPTWMYDFQIRHIFVDPTACHTLVSAGNGELYYIHSTSNSGPSGVASCSNTSVSSLSNAFPPSLAISGNNLGTNNISTNSNSGKHVVRLSGFGVHSTKMEWLTGVAATSVPGHTPTAATGSNVPGATSPFVQVGLSYGTYVTSVAWDREQGTEGSTKRILLGTNAGEIYEYSLNSSVSSSSKTDEQKPSGDDNYSGIQQPVLVHKLYYNHLHVNPTAKRFVGNQNAGNLSAPTNLDPTEVGAAVTGLYFERLRTGILVLAATSGKQKRTRFYTFYSPHSSSFRMVFSSSDRTLQELPGSIDCADLKMCNDHFALRTAIGIYYGTIDRSLTGPACLSGGGGNMIIESGILPYDILQPQDPSKWKQSALSVSLSSSSNYQHNNIQSNSYFPVSIAITPHHIVTVDDTNEVCFINRVAQEVIQRERLASLSSSVTEPHFHSGSIDLKSIVGVDAELMMDIRRPEQVWLRRGRALVHLSPSQEDRDVWKFTLHKSLEMKGGIKAVILNHSKKKRYSVVSPAAQLITSSQLLSEEEKTQEAMFEQSKTLCTNGLQKSVVTAIRAEYHIAQGRAELAAKYFAQCPSSLKPFTETAVRLALPKLGIDDPQGYGTRQAWSALSSSNIPLITYRMFDFLHDFWCLQYPYNFCLFCCQFI